MTQTGARQRHTARAALETAPPAFVSGICAERNRHWLLLAAVLASALGFIDGSVVAIAMPAMRADLDAGLTQAQWISNAYMITLSALILAGGAMGDRFGLVRVFGGGIALFVLASVACALAPSANMLIAARAVQGTGAAFMVPGSLALIARAYPPESRGAAIGTWAAASAVTTALGPVLGGLLLSAGSDGAWRIIFAINLPLGALALWLLWRTAEADPATEDARVDWLGAVLATTGLGLLALALTGAEHGQAGTGRDLAWGIAAVCILLVFIWVEKRSANPMLPLDIFARPGFAAMNAVTLLLYFSLSGVLFFLPQTVISAWGASALMASAAFVPLSVSIGVLSPFVGRLSDHTGARPLIATGCFVVALAYLGMGLTADQMAFWQITFPWAVLSGFGMALVVAPLSTAVMAAAGEANAGAASGINNAVARSAGLIAVAALGPVAAAVYAANGGDVSFAAIPQEGTDTELQEALATTRAFATIALIAGGMALAAAVVAAFSSTGGRPPKL